jgi:hypothetical protein
MPHTETYIGGIWYPSVSTIIGSKPKPWLEAWKEEWGVLAERKAKIANAIGTEFHRCVDSWLTTQTYAVLPPAIDGFVMPSTIPRVEGMMRSFVAWAEETNGIIYDTELKVVSHLYTYSGTLDAVGTFGKKLVVYDWKTSSRIYDDMQLQLSAYGQAYKEQEGRQAKLGIIVCVSKDKPSYRLTTKEFKLGKRAFNKFLELREKFGPMEVRKAGL